MAYTAVHLPMDKDQDQLCFWPDNDELNMIGDSFAFDQFMTFDTGEAASLDGEFLEDPPSPSVLLDSLQNGLINTSSSTSILRPENSHGEGFLPTTDQPVEILPDSNPIDNIDTSQIVFPTLPGDILSVSDSELLHLGGISLRSSPPRAVVTAPSSPLLALLTPSSPRKHSRLADTGYNTAQSMAHGANLIKPNEYQHVNMANFDPFIIDPACGADTLVMNYDNFINPSVIVKSEPTDSCDLTTSSPFTGQNFPRHNSCSSGFVNGHLDDPFTDNIPGAPTISRPIERRDSSAFIATPMSKTQSPFQHAGITAPHTNIIPFRNPRKLHRSMSSAEWPTQGLMADDKYNKGINMWPSALPSSSSSSSVMYAPGNENGNIASPIHWEGEMMHSETTPRHRHRVNRTGPQHHHAATRNIPTIHNQQPIDLPYEFEAAAANAAGLMLQMPRPRGPPATVLSTNLDDHVFTGGPAPPPSKTAYHNNMHTTPNVAHASSSHHHPHFQNNNSNGGGSEKKSNGHGHVHGQTDNSRRPKPRAPSSGARHHGSQISPRKLRHSMSLGYLREEAQDQQQQSPQQQQPQHQQQQPHYNHHQERRHQRSSSLTMRKQRSFTRRPGNGNGEGRTASTSTQGSSSGGGGGGGDNNNNIIINGGVGAGGPSSSAVGGSGRGGGGGGGGGFINFTPDDKKKLMAGVAPSGSSKTKLRREKEAQEHTRRIREAALRVFDGDVGPAVLKDLMGDIQT